MVAMAMDEAETLRPAPKLIIFAAFQFDPEAAKDIDEMNWPGVTLLKAQMNTDLMTEDLKKKRSSDQSFWLVGQPDVELIHGRAKNKYKVRVNGFDYYDVKKGTVESGSTSRIAMWMLDTDYDGMCIEPKQVFFPMGGKNDGWNKLAKTLKAGSLLQKLYMLRPAHRIHWRFWQNTEHLHSFPVPHEKSEDILRNLLKGP